MAERLESEDGVERLAAFDQLTLLVSIGRIVLEHMTWTGGVNDVPLTGSMRGEGARKLYDLLKRTRL